MLSKKMAALLNDQVQAETYASHLYLAMAAYCTVEGFHGFAHWFKIQSKEEWGHAMKIFDYVLERGGKPAMKGVKAPQLPFAPSPTQCNKP